MDGGSSGFSFRRSRAPDGTLSYPFFSDSVTRVLGFSPSDMTETEDVHALLLHPADRDRYLTEIDRSAATLTPCIEDYRAITRGGAVRWLKGISLPHRTLGGDVVWDGAVRDMSELHRTKLFLDVLMRTTGDFIFILNDSDSILTGNSFGLKMLGRTLDEVLGEPLSLLFPEIDDEMLSAGADSTTRVIETWGQRKDGTSCAVELSITAVQVEKRQYIAIAGRDLTIHKKNEAALLVSERRLQLVTDNVPGVVFQRVLRPDGSLAFVYVSRGAREFLGIEPAELLEDPNRYMRLMTSRERREFLEALGRSAQNMTPFEEEISFRAPGGVTHWLHGQSVPILQENGDIIWDGVLMDVTDRKVAEQRLSFLAFHDPLTHLPNYGAFQERLAEACARGLHTGEHMAIISIGIDRFSVINATLGLRVGDQVLIATAQTLLVSLERRSIMARGQGDRFLLLLAGYKTPQEVIQATERIHTIAQKGVSSGGMDFQISMSSGAVLFPGDGIDSSSATPAETLILHAEAAFQRAKGRGSGILQFYNKEMGERALKFLNLQTRLRKAIKNQELLPYFQPQVHLKTGKIIGMEALARWKCPGVGFIPPNEFIPAAEEPGLIDSIFEIILTGCARQIRDWKDRGIPTVPIAVNVSGRQFRYALHLLSLLKETVAKFNIEPQDIQIELTESSAMQDPETAISVVKQLREMGIRCAIDDFGTGYSSLSVLKKFPIDKLKIDRSFVMDITTDHNDAAIVQAIMAMARALEMEVIAEGVEQAEHLAFLRNLGCDVIQGYYFSRPVPAEEMERMLLEGRGLAAVDMV